MNKRTLWLLAMLFATAQLSAQFAVTGADTPAFGPVELIEEVCLGEGIQVLDIEFNGVPSAVGRFSGGQAAVGLGEGFLMTTGIAATASGGAGADLPGWWEANIPNGSQASHPELPALANDDIFDVAVYTIRFIPTGDSIMFRYVFASEEYPQFVCSNFNDVFGFFLTGPDQDGNAATINIAKVPGTDLAVSINSVNSGIPGSHPLVNLAYCLGDNGSLDNAELFNNNFFDVPVYNGYTDVFVAKAAVTPCQEYTMSLVLADIGDALWDSGLFFEANSFCSFAGGGHDSETVTVVEACSPGLLEVGLGNFPDEDFPLTYAIAGSAEVGVDYTLAGISASGQVDGPADSWLLELEALDDGLEEGVETIEISLQGAACSEKTYTIRLVDPFRIEGPSSALCSAEPVALTVVGDSAALADYPLIWDDGQEGASIQVIPDGTTEYTLDYGGYLFSCRVSFTISVDNPESELNLELCSNEDGVVVNGTLYDFYNPAGTEVLAGGSAAGCDSTVYINIMPKVSFNLEEGVCSGQGILVNGTLYGEGNLTGLEVISAGAQDGCDSVVFVNLATYPQQSSAMEVTLNEGETFSLGGQTFAANGNYELAFPNQNGCDSLVLLQVNVKTQTSVLTDSIAVGQLETLCLDTAFLQSVARFANACADPESGTEWVFPADGACLEYLGLSPGVDTACLVVCDGLGLCDTTIFIVSVFDYLLDAVWPGDVNNDGRVNQIDHWAVGLGYGLNGPVRPNASNAWTAQPMIDWNGSLTFIYQFNRKYADCNGDGQINSGDTYAIYANFGRTHPLSPEAFDFPDRAIPAALEAEAAGPEYTELSLSFGDNAQPLIDAYGLAFEAYFDPAAVADIRFLAGESWLGTEGEDLMVLSKMFPENGIGYVSLVRTDHNPQPGAGRVGALRLLCPDNNCGAVTVRNIQFLQSDGDAFDASGELLWQADALSAAANRLDNQVELFPNPARELLWVSLPASGTAQLFGANGQLAWAGALQQGRNEIAVKGLSAGVYVLKIQMTEGIVTKKLVVMSDKN
ncbi:MAG: choice-of-anchor L domain-containing protein [Lewinellaceae bacterium]|nr:choice-of-anchor L domain-containing protein [Phaeodactylibacter sp.]MCB9040770.1 choice-of-anchor L domain-containing protein [Lewinellaceae bacterium]